MASRAVIAALTLVATLSLAGCATPAPAYVVPSGTPTATVAAEPEDPYQPIVALTGESQCPERWVPAPMSPEYAERYPNQAVTTEIAPDDFDPAAVGDILERGCVTVGANLNDDGTESRNYQALVAGGPDLVDDLDSALRADGFETTGSGVYHRKTTTVVLWGNDEGFTSEQLVSAGFPDEEYVIIQAYRSEPID